MPIESKYPSEMPPGYSISSNEFYDQWTAWPPLDSSPDDPEGCGTVYTSEDACRKGAWDDAVDTAIRLLKSRGVTTEDYAEFLRTTSEDAALCAQEEPDCRPEYPPIGRD